MDDSNHLATTIHVRCPKCGSPVVVNGFYWRLQFPSDDELIATVLEGKLNLAACPVCHTESGLLMPFLAIRDGNPRRCLLVEGQQEFAQALLDESGQSLLEHLAQATLCKDYGELRHAMLSWVFEEVKDLALLTVTGEIVRAGRAERMQLATRLRLRLVRMIADDVLTMAVQLPPAMAARVCDGMGDSDIASALRKLWPRQVDGLVFQLLHDEFHAALEAGGLADLTARIERRLAVPLLGEGVLQHCVEECLPLAQIAEHPEKFHDAYRDHFLNAVAHHLAGRSNPVRAEWASFLRFAFYAQRQDKFPDVYLPGHKEAADLVRFEDLWNERAPGLLNQEPARFKALLHEIEQLMDRFGHSERLRAMLKANPLRPQLTAENVAEQAERLRTGMLEALKERFPFPLDDDNRHAFASFAANLVNNLTRSGLPGEATRLSHDVLQLALDAKDYLAAFDVGVQSVMHLAHAELFGEAAAVLQPLIDRFMHADVTAQFSAAGAAGARLAVDFWNEAGNILRQVGHRDGSLGAYGIARNLLDLVEEDSRHELERVIWANEARTFRDAGRYSEARQRLVQVLQQTPDDVSALHSMALLHLLLSEFEEALACTDRALRAPQLNLEPLQQARLLQTRGMVQAGAGDHAAALLDLSGALDVAPTHAAALVTQICAAIAMFTRGAGRELLERVRSRLLAVLRGEVTDHAASGMQRNLHATALVAYGELLIAQGSDAELAAYFGEWLSPFVEAENHDHRSLPWQLLAMRGRVAARLEGLAPAWPWFERALGRLDTDSPTGKDVSALLGWLRDKSRFQLELADVAIELARAGRIAAQALLPVFEFSIGRSTSAKLGEDSVFATATRVPQGLADASANLNGKVHAIAFLEGREEVQGFAISAGQATPRLLSHARLRPGELRMLQSNFTEALGFANPSDLAVLDDHLGDWLAFARTLGPLLRQDAADGDTIALLPCSSLAGLPLHLCPCDDTGATLVERFAVIYAGNFGTLLSQPARNLGVTGRLVASVAKADDRRAFRDALATAADRIATARPEETRVLAGTGTALGDLLAALQRCEEAWFLCHGAYGGRDAGFALCISDGVMLPPSLLSIDTVPELKRFTLDWKDLESLECAPRMFVSIACSSGRTLVDAGGSRLGIEQALLAKGTRAIISPQWDVDQDAAIAWLHAFEEVPSPRRTTTVARCRDAAAVVRERFDHWFFWGPFVLTGSLFEA